jgi:hypothetical protein
MERRGRKGSWSAGCEEIERVGDRQEKTARYCSTGQSPQQAVLMEEEELSCVATCHVYICKWSWCKLGDMSWKKTRIKLIKYIISVWYVTLRTLRSFYDIILSNCH